MILTILLSRLRAWLKLREHMRELSRLTDRELTDIGVNRSCIESAAREAQK